MQVQYINSNWNWCAEVVSDIVLTIGGHLHLHRSCSRSFVHVTDNENHIHVLRSFIVDINDNES